MQVILLERVEKLGQMGDEVKVKDGFARNYLLPKKKALRATEANRKYFETQKAQLEARNLERKTEAEAVAAKLEGQSFVLLALGRRPRPALRLGLPARHRRCRQRRRLLDRPHPGAARQGDQDDRPVPGFRGAASRSARRA